MTSERPVCLFASPPSLYQGKASYVEPDCQGIFHTTCFFVGSNMRKPIAEGRADYCPIYLSDIPSLFRRRVLPLDVALVQVSPPDRHGYCSLGACGGVSVLHVLVRGRQEG